MSTGRPSRGPGHRASGGGGGIRVLPDDAIRVTAVENGARQPSGKVAAVPIDAVQSRVYEVPTDGPEADGTISWSSTTVVTCELVAGPWRGLGWTYGAAASKDIIDSSLADVLCGSEALAPTLAHECMVRACRNIGRPGVAAGSISAADIAGWDLKAKVLGVSIADLLGPVATVVPVYGSGGFTTYDDQRTEAQLRHFVDELGARQVKIKIGESWGRCEEGDRHRVALARRVIGDGPSLFVDANGAYDVKQAIRMGRWFEAEAGVSWFEEPVSSDDVDGLAKVREALSLDVAAGEYGYDETYFARMAGAGSVDCLQADVTRCGGYTSWLRISGLASSLQLGFSAHCAPSLHLHAAAAVPGLRHVEWFYDHARLDPLLFHGTARVQDGVMVVDRTVEGHGMSLRAEAEAYRVR